MGLTNTPTHPNEYPIEYLYREVLSQDQLLEALSFFLVRVPEHEAEDDKPARPASTIFPRYHQSRLVRRVADDITAHFATTGDIGKKYLADHSAGSGKTLSVLDKVILPRYQVATFSCRGRQLWIWRWKHSQDQLRRP